MRRERVRWRGPDPATIRTTGILVLLVLLIGALVLVWVRRAAEAPVTLSPWPGPTGVTSLHAPDLPLHDVSGLDHVSDGSPQGVLWAVENAGATLYRLVEVDGAWRPGGSQWANGLRFTYADGTGSPDAEGLALAGSEDVVYVVTERDSDAPDVSSLRVLRIEPNEWEAGGAEDPAPLPAVREWDLTGDFEVPPGPNEGFEGIAYIPDDDLTAARFLDQSTGKRYDPEAYGEHAGGVFFLAMEETGTIYGYVLADDGTHQQIAELDSGLPMLASLHYDAETERLWAMCDDECGGELAVFGVRGGRFVVRARHERPGSMPDTNNEGFVMATSVECDEGLRAAYWADDHALEDHVLRRGALACP